PPTGRWESLPGPRDRLVTRTLRSSGQVPPVPSTNRASPVRSPEDQNKEITTARGRACHEKILCKWYKEPESTWDLSIGQSPAELPEQRQSPSNQTRVTR